MTSGTSIVVWCACAIAVFWAVGAYNRLVRLRGDAIEAFGHLDAQLLRHVELAQSCVSPALLEASAAWSVTGPLPVWAGLAGSVQQFGASLSVARHQPLDAEAMRALYTAVLVLTTAWNRLSSEPDDLAGSRIPEAFQLQWREQMLLTAAATESFNAAIARYNAAIGEFPASLLAAQFGFKAAHPLQSWS